MIVSNKVRRNNYVTRIRVDIGYESLHSAYLLSNVSGNSLICSRLVLNCAMRYRVNLFHDPECIAHLRNACNWVCNLALKTGPRFEPAFLLVMSGKVSAQRRDVHQSQLFISLAVTDCILSDKAIR